MIIIPRWRFQRNRDNIALFKSFMIELPKLMAKKIQNINPTESLSHSKSRFLPGTESIKEEETEIVPEVTGTMDSLDFDTSTCNELLQSQPSASKTDSQTPPVPINVPGTVGSLMSDDLIIMKDISICRF